MFEVELDETWNLNASLVEGKHRLHKSWFLKLIYLHNLKFQTHYTNQDILILNYTITSFQNLQAKHT